MKMDITSVAVTRKGVVYLQAKVTCGMKKDDFKVGDTFQCTKLKADDGHEDEKTEEVKDDTAAKH
jgi:hypothetical protein